jgi:hypothetical protein
VNQEPRRLAEGEKMKRFISLVLFGSLLLLQGRGFAEVPDLEIKISGMMDAVSFLYRNIAPGAPPLAPGDPGQGIYSFTTPPLRPDSFPDPLSSAWDKTNAYMESRARLKFDAMMGKAVSGTIFLEIDSFRWGDPDGTRNSAGYWGADRVAVEVKNFYMDLGLPYFGIPIPMMLRVGVQPLYLRPYIFTYTDGAGISGAIKIDPVIINPFWFKAIEGKDAASDDVDIYGLNISADVGSLKIGGYGVYYNMNTYPLDSVTMVYGESPPYRADAWWFGVYTEGRLGPIELDFDAVYDYGEVESRSGTSAPSVKYRGWASRLTINYPWDKFNIGAKIMYASGADQKKTSPSGLPGTTTPYGGVSTNVGSYVTPPGSEQWAGGESLIVYGSWVARSDIGFYVWPFTAYTNLTRGGWGGTWFAKLFAGFKATPWYKISLEVLYVGDTTKNGNTLGNAQKANGQPRDDKTIGWEFDLINAFEIYKNLKYEVGLGYLLPGDALDQLGAYGENASFKDPWILASRLVYEF